MTNERAQSSSGYRQGEHPDDASCAGIGQSITLDAFHDHGSGHGSDVSVRKGDRQGLQTQLRTATVAFEFVHFSVHQRAGRDYDFIAQGNGSRDLSVDVVSAMNVPALNGVSKYESKIRACGDRLRN